MSTPPAGGIRPAQCSEVRAAVERELRAQRLPMLIEHPSVVDALGEQEDHHAGRRVVSQLERDAALDGLHIVEVDLALDGGGLDAVRHALVPRAQVAGQRQPHFATHAEGRSEHPIEAAEYAQLARVAQAGAVGIGLEAGDQADRSRRLADERERRTAELSPLEAAELCPTHTGACRDCALTRARRSPRIADLPADIRGEPPGVRGADCRCPVARTHDRIVGTATQLALTANGRGRPANHWPYGRAERRTGRCEARLTGGGERRRRMAHGVARLTGRPFIGPPAGPTPGDQRQPAQRQPARRQPAGRRATNARRRTPGGPTPGHQRQAYGACPERGARRDRRRPHPEPPRRPRGQPG